MSETFAPYQKLLARMREVALVGSTGSMLSWDQETYMPPKAIDYRAEQLAFLSGWAHRQFTASDVGGWLEACEAHAFAPNSVEAVNVREWRRQYDRQARLPVALVEAMERARVLGREAWVQARKASVFETFRPHLETILDLNRQMAEHWGYEDSPYDALLEEYEPGVRASALKPLFAELRREIMAILPGAVAWSESTPADLLQGEYPEAAQQAFNREVAAAFGFDFEAGRIDTTTHPFCTGLGPRDCRITTRYDEKDFTQSLYGVMHETGHGLYEQGLLEEHYGTPLGSAVSLGMHESQSRFWENHIGRHPTFWERWHEAACSHFPGLRRLTPDHIGRAVSRVTPSFIRVEADEVTYDLHIILRFEVEVKLVEGQLSARDVPAYWNENFREMFGLEVPNDRMGCLQDIHWSMGSLGYFPTYTLGNLNSAQLFAAMHKAEPDLEAQLRRGSYEALLHWLRSRVHHQGCRLRPPELMVFATGQTTQAEFHVRHLRRKFLGG